MNKSIAVEGGLRSSAEKLHPGLVMDCFNSNPLTTSAKLEQFPKYVPRQKLTRFLALYEIFKLAMPIKGSIVECGVFHGFGAMTWLKLSSILEPVNIMRKVYCFDTFSGFPAVGDLDRSHSSMHVKEGQLFAPPLHFGRPTPHRNCLPETVPWPVGPDTRLEF